MFDNIFSHFVPSDLVQKSGLLDDVAGVCIVKKDAAFPLLMLRTANQPSCICARGR